MNFHQGAAVQRENLGLVVKYKNSEATLSEFRMWLPDLLAVQLLVNHLPSLCLSFLI